MKTDIWEIDVMKDETAYLTPEQIDQLIAKVPENPHNLIVRLLWRTGARITEILNLKKIHINFIQKEIIIKTLKQKSKDKKRPTRRIPLNDETLLSDLANYTKTIQQKDKIFPFVTRFNVYYKIRIAGKQIGLDEIGEKSHIHPHILRHSFAIHWVKQGLPLNILKEILGHSSILTTSFYQKFHTRDKHEYIRKMWEK